MSRLPAFLFRRNFLGVVFVLLLGLPLFIVADSGGVADDKSEIQGTAGDDVIVSGSEDTRFLPGSGDNYVIGGPGDNTYRINAGDSRDIISDAQGTNIVEFGAGVTYSDIASGLQRSGDDLFLKVDGSSQTVTVKSFFSLKNTISEFRFQNSQPLSGSDIYGVFGVSAPTEEAAPRGVRTESDGSGLVEGTSGSDVLIQGGSTDRLWGVGGDDYLVAGDGDAILEVGAGEGKNLIIASSGNNILRFREGVQYEDVSSQIQKQGDDLILKEQAGGGQVRVHQFFTRANTIEAIQFKAGGSISSEQIFQLFGTSEPTSGSAFEVLNVNSGSEGGQSDTGAENDDDSTQDSGDCAAGQTGCSDGSSQDSGGSGTDDGSGDTTDSGSSQDSAEGPVQMDGGPEEDILVAGTGKHEFDGGAGDDLMYGNTGDDIYRINKGAGNDLISDVEGSNVIRFGADITYSQVSSGLSRRNDDLVLNIGSDGQSVTIKNFFSLANTISELRFQESQPLTNDQLFQAFGESAPTSESASRTALAQSGSDGVLAGTTGPDVLVQDDTTSLFRAQKGTDELIAVIGDITFEFGGDDGKNRIRAFNGTNTVHFKEDVNFNDVASELLKRGEDLVLGNSAGSTEVIIKGFFARSNTVDVITFESGGEITADQLFSQFGVDAPSATSSMTAVVSEQVAGGSHNGSGDDTDDGGDSGSGSDDGSGDSGGDGSGDGEEPSPDRTLLVGTAQNDLIITGPGEYQVESGVGNDVVLGSAGSDFYRVTGEPGKTIINDAEGQDILAFSSDVARSQVTGGLIRSGDDFVISVQDTERKVVISDFFSVSNTITEIRFANDPPLSVEQLRNIFDVSEPATERNTPEVVPATGATTRLSGSSKDEILIPRMGTEIIEPKGGNDYLVGAGMTPHFGLGTDTNDPGSVEGEKALIYHFNGDYGKDTVFAYEGRSIIQFGEDIVREEITTNLVRRGDDLLLGSKENDNKVTVADFFARPNTIDSIIFDTGPGLSASDIFRTFDVSEPSSSDGFHVLARSLQRSACNSNANPNGAQGFGLTEEQLSANSSAPSLVSSTQHEVLAAYEDLSHLFRAEDPDNLALCFELVSGPDGMEINPETGLLQWSTERSDIGGHTARIRVSNAIGASSEHDIEIDVVDPLPPLAFTTTPVTHGVLGEDYRYPVEVTAQSSRDSVQFELIEAPQGLELENGILQGGIDPGNGAGVKDVVIKAIDGLGAEAEHSFELELEKLKSIRDTPEGHSRVPRTGARYSKYPGEDGALQAGTPRVYERDDAREVVKDKVNGLVWQDNAAVINERQDYFSSAEDYCSNLQHGGIDDWRLPNRMELVFLLEHFRTDEDSHLINRIFENVGVGKHSNDEFFAKKIDHLGHINNWNSTVSFSDADVLPVDSRETWSGVNVRCVSGESQFTPEYEKPETNNITVDRTNRLMWQDNSEVVDFSGTLEESLKYCKNLELAGYEDWRLPNFNESQALLWEFALFVEEGQESKHFTHVPGDNYWHSSTRATGNTRSANDDLSDRNWRFRYQYDRDSGYAGSRADNLNNRTGGEDGELSVRCVRSYAEPEPELAEVPPESTNAGETLHLDGSETHHAEGEIKRYEWKDLTTGKILGESAVVEAELTETGEHELQLQVWDQHGLSQTLPGPLTITVFGPPTITIEGPRSAWADQSIVLDASESSDVSGIESFEWTSPENDEVLSEKASLTLEASSAGEKQYRLKVTNKRGMSATEQVSVRFVERPDVAVEGEREVLLGETVSLDARETTSMDDIESYQWRDPETGDVLSEEALLEMNDLPVGSHAVELVIKDTNGLTHRETIQLEVDTHQPVIEVEDNVVAAEGEPFQLDASGSHVPHGEVQSYRWFKGSDSEPVGNGPQLDIDGLTKGSWTYHLEVESAAGKTSSRIVEVQTGPLPEAALPEEVFDYAHTETVLDGSASSIREGSLTYEWRLDGEKVGDTEKARLQEGLEVGEYQVELTVHSDIGLSDTAETTLTVERARELSTCPFVPVEKDDYEPRYPEGNVEWRGNKAGTVDDIARAFNHARSVDPSVFEYLIMSDQATWDEMTLPEKGLYLVNAERAARGIKPYAGVDSSITAAAQEFAEYIRGNNKPINHYADGRSPLERMDSQPFVAEHRDSTSMKTESLASGTSSEAPSEDYALVRGIFNWLYRDADWFEDFEWADGPGWGHRDQLLQTGLNDNQGAPDTEGLAGFGVDVGDYAPGGDASRSKGYVTAFKTLDQGPEWDPDRITTVDISGAQGCNTNHVIEIDPNDVDTKGLRGLRVEPNTVLLTPDGAASIRVMGLYESGGEVDFTPHARFRADRRSVVSVDDGRITAERAGQARVLARVGEHESNRIHVRVRESAQIQQLAGTEAEPFLRHVADNATAQSYDPQAMTVYTGRVENRDGTPLSGVHVSFLNRPEHGSVTTGDDGRFELTGPAGERTVVYEKSGYVVVQRTTIGASDDWAAFDDVTLLERDDKISRIDLTSGEPEVHQSSVTSDEFGERRATVIFDDITTATVVSEDGSERELESFDFSATEFETPASMPGELPEETAFTYATDLHVAGTHYTDTVSFDGDVVMYVDNFLGFEVGEIVPIGLFDRVSNGWEASSNGVVVQTVDESGNGEVDGVDFNGDGVADDLNDSGDPRDDAAGLDSYEPGDTLWWGSFSHFTPADYNWAPSDAEAPSALEIALDQEDPQNYELECTGSYAKPHQQSFHEDIEIDGTGLTLHYSSQRTDGYKHQFEITASGDEVPDSLQRIVARLEIAGRVFEREVEPEPNQEVTFTWDGTSPDGERPEGMVSGRVSIGHEYPTVYMSSGNAAEQEQGPGDFPVAWAYVGNEATEVPGREAFISWESSGITVKNSYERQLAEGWSISNVHEYDPAGQVYRGDGGTEEAAAQSVVLKTGQTQSFVEGDDGSYQAGGNTHDYSVTAQGTLQDQVTGLTWEYTEQPNEERTKDAAREYCANAPDLPGQGWRLPTPKEIAYTMDKGGANPGPAIYAVNSARNLWHQRTANPEEEPMPVQCVRGESLDQRYVQGLERNASKEVVVDQDNGLMWQDSAANVGNKKTWEDSIAYCEASSHAGYDDWRLPNINELLYVLPNDVFVYQSEWEDTSEQALWNYKVDFREPYWSSTTNHRDAGRAWAIESKSYNSERFHKDDAFHVRCVRDAGSASRMPYRFDSDGRHIATVDLDSGKKLTTFEYNDNDRVVGIVDQFGNRTTIEGDAEGTPVRIVAPDGETTRLSVDDQGYLQSIQYADNSAYQFDYGAGGLLTSKTDPRGNTHTRLYNDTGRVVTTKNPEGGQWDFFDKRKGIGHDQYGFSTAEGQEYQTDRRVLDDGTVEKVTNYKDGTETTHQRSADGLTESYETCGVSTEIQYQRDRKTRNPVPERITVTQPSGLTQVNELDQQYAENGADTSQYTVTGGSDGQFANLEVDARAGTITGSSPEGRSFTQRVDTETRLLESVSADGLLETTFDYDDRGRLISRKAGDRHVQYTYNDQGRVAAVTAPDGRTTSYEYDERGRITRVIHPDGQTLENQYDAKGNRTTLVVPTPAEHDFEYDGVDRVTERRSPMDSATRYHYDRDGRLTATTLPSGERIEHTYSGGQRSSTTTPEGVINYDYLCGGRLSQVSEGGESLQYQWDGNLLTEARYQGELNASIQYGYNSDFKVDQLSYAGASTSLSYDADGLLTGINGFTLERSSEHGLVTELSDTTLSQTRTYNGHGETAGVQNSVSQHALYDYTLERNKLGQITTRTETLADGTVNEYQYSYDDRRRLTAVHKNGQLVEQYEYDANGNRTEATSTGRGVSGETASYNQDDQLVSRNGTDYEYDANGRLARKTTASGDVTEYDYSSQGRLQKVVTPQQTVEYRHNAQGNRVAKLVDGEVVEKYPWADKTTLLATYDGSGNLKKRFEYTDGNTPTKFTQNGETYYILTDQLGSPRVMRRISWCCR
ncbi:MAG: DUF1566 domain-containing protein [Halospina sp.]